MRNYFSVLKTSPTVTKQI